MTVYFVGAGPGDPELITVKGKKLVEQADLIIYAGSLVNPGVLKHMSGSGAEECHLCGGRVPAQWSKRSLSLHRCRRDGCAFTGQGANRR